MSCAYFWDGTRVIEMHDQPTWQTVNVARLMDMPCVDTYCPTPEARYGYFEYTNGWRALPLEDFPAEFRTHLLLLGVS